MLDTDGRGGFNTGDLECLNLSNRQRVNANKNSTRITYQGIAMSDAVIFRLEIPLSDSIASYDSIAFHQWLPLGDDDRLVISEGERTLVLRFTPKCSSSPESCEPIALSKWSNPYLQVVIAEVTVNNLSDELVVGLRHPKSDDTSVEWLYDNPHRRLAISVIEFALPFVNRLIGYARCHKGQFRLEFLTFDAKNLHSALIRFNAKVRIGPSDWFVWNPPGIGGVFFAKGYEPARCINQKDWSEAKNYVNSDARPPLVRELLAGAESLAEKGHNRSALAEAVTALEVAIHNFGRHPGANAAFGSVLANRMNIQRLANQIKHMGVNGSVRYLLPVIFPEDKVASTILRNCADALEQRQQIVHHGKLRIDDKQLQLFLKSIRELCQTLEHLTAE